MYAQRKHTHTWLPLALSSLLLCFVMTHTNTASAKKPAPQKKRAAKKKKKKKKKVARFNKTLDEWFRLGPASSPMPIFHKDKEGGVKLRKWFAFPHTDVSSLHPKAGTSHTWLPYKTLTWRKGKATFKIDGDQPQIAYLSTYITVDQYTKLSLKLRSHQRLRVFIDGKAVATKWGCTKAPKGKKSHQHKKASNTKKATKTFAAPTSRPAAKGQQALLLQLTELLKQQNKVLLEQARTLRAQSKLLKKQQPTHKAAPKRGTLRAKLTLVPGIHHIVIKTMYTSKCLHSWDLKASLKGKTSSKPQLHLTRKERHSTTFLLNRTKLAGSSISPDGREAIVWYKRTKTNGKSDYWHEVRRLKDGHILHSSQPRSLIRGFRWSPDSTSYTFTTRAGKTASIWRVDRATHKVTLLRKGIHKLQYYTWSPDSRFILYAASTKIKLPKSGKAGVKRLRGMVDRWPWYRNRSHLYALSADGKTQTRLTSGEWTTSGPSLRRDGKKILFVRSRPDHSKRPFRTNDLYELDLQTFKLKKILSGLRWLNGAMYSPKGDKLLLLGAATLFGSIGRAKSLPAKVIPNAYDTQAYIYDLKRKEVKAISRDFSPTIRSAYWHPIDGQIYLNVLDRTYYRIFRYDMKTGTYTQIETGVDQALRVSFASNSTRITYIGSGIDHPGRLFTLALHDPKPQMLYAPNAKWLGRMQLAKVKPWSFRLKSGRQIDGRVYYPPGFDPRKKYPVIVYYYGGTYPTTRSFDGRYPAQLWAAHNYLVYILQPSGAIGFGQGFASFHVGEWGTRVADEIIEGTKRFLKAHSFADAKRVGCIGASYGGFMTMYLTTRTNIFAAAISHAGISNITSYWGGGFWGFLYNSVSAANLYPWSHPEFYVNQSPLYAADKVKTPLLLLHGSVDTNVPPHESYQMYAALRLLKRPVELVVVKKADHWVLRYKKRLIWTRTIIAWFDRYLKKQGLWWKDLHGSKQH